MTPISTAQHEALTEMAKRRRWHLVVLFGSTAREGSGRDIDLAIDPKQMPDLFGEARWLRELEALFSPVPVDLMLLSQSTSPLARFEVFRDGICLYEEEANLFDREQDRAFFLYADSEPLRRANREDFDGRYTP